MDKNEIKKVLYKEKPMAIVFLHTMRTDVFKYVAKTSLGEVYFKVPVSEMGETPFGPREQAQLLIRWIVSKEDEVFKSDSDKATFIHAIVNPPNPSEKLKEAQKRYKDETNRP